MAGHCQQPVVLIQYIRELPISETILVFNCGVCKSQRCPDLLDTSSWNVSLKKNFKRLAGLHRMQDHFHINNAPLVVRYCFGSHTFLHRFWICMVIFGDYCRKEVWFTHVAQLRSLWCFYGHICVFRLLRLEVSYPICNSNVSLSYFGHRILRNFVLRCKGKPFLNSTGTFCSEGTVSELNRRINRCHK